MTEPERLILGWCLERGEVPACVVAIPVDALSGPAAVIRGLLVELQGVGMTWGPVDLYLWLTGKHAPTTEIGRSLLAWLSTDEVLLLPAVVPVAMGEVVALCRLLEEQHAARVACAEALAAAQERAEKARVAAMDDGCDMLRRACEPKNPEGLLMRRVVPHPGWKPYLRENRQAVDG
jgi:hypothetical protein